jgi:hypothetical protein
VSPNTFQITFSKGADRAVKRMRLNEDHLKSSCEEDEVEWGSPQKDGQNCEDDEVEWGRPIGLPMSAPKLR